MRKSKQINQKHLRHYFDMDTHLIYPLPCIQIMEGNDFFFAFLIFSYRLSVIKKTPIF